MGIENLERRRPHPMWGTRYWLEIKTGCWIWNGTLDRHGYGRWRTGFKLAHRVVYEELVGPIPEGKELDHVCEVRSCVNPAHLTPATRQENSDRANKYRRLSRVCKNGHDLRETQRWRKSNPRKWWCSACDREYRRKREQETTPA